jgi:hypothetical protein
MSLPLLPGFLHAGFECSTHLDRNLRRIDEISLTEHDRHVREDYHRLRGLGIRVARDGVRWPLIDRRGRLDFGSVQPFVEAAEAEGITVIWDLFHYGYPDDIDPFHCDFTSRFADYCYAFARLLARRGHTIPFYTPVNEISFLAWAATDGDLFAPRAAGLGNELKRILVRAAIAGMDALLAVNPRARFVHCDPLINVVAPADAPDLHGEAEYYNYHFVHEAWDMIAGVKEPELGGKPAYLDIIGVNYYGINQWEHQRPGSVLPHDDPRRKPFSELLQRLHTRYDRPLIITETSSQGELRPQWVRDIGHECLRAVEMGVDLHGVCLYPVIDMYEWHQWETPTRMGLWDLCRCEHSGRLERVVHEATLFEVNRLQARFTEMASRRRREARIGATDRDLQAVG